MMSRRSMLTGSLVATQRLHELVAARSRLAFGGQPGQWAYAESPLIDGSTAWQQ